jgi:hypothetical protein
LLRVSPSSWIDPPEQAGGALVPLPVPGRALLHVLGSLQSERGEPEPSSDGRKALGGRGRAVEPACCVTYSMSPTSACR